MNYPAKQGLQIIQSHWRDNTPRRADLPIFTESDSTRSTASAIDAMIAEFNTRWNAGDWKNLREADAITAFRREIARR